MSTLTRIRAWLVFFVIALVLSGVTAFPLETETDWLTHLLHAGWSPFPSWLPEQVAFIDRVHEGLAADNRRYPFIAYGTDWLAFAHLVIAVAFWGPYRDPVRNVWIVRWGMIACGGVIPLALIAGPIRHLPGWWLPIDMSFGVLGILPLLVVLRLIHRLEGERSRAAEITVAAAATAG